MTPVWAPPPIRGSVPTTGRRTRTGSCGSTLACVGGETTARPAARRHPGVSHLPRTNSSCGTQSHMGTARWWPGRRGGPWALRTNTAPWSKVRRRPPSLRPRLLAVLAWWATPLRPSRGHGERHIQPSSSWPLAPPPPRPAAHAPGTYRGVVGAAAIWGFHCPLVAHPAAPAAAVGGRAAPYWRHVLVAPLRGTRLRSLSRGGGTVA